MTDSTKPTSMRYRREVNVANNTLASILERYNRVLEQVLQRIDILEKGQKLDRTGRDMDTDDFEKLAGKVQRMDEKLTARVNDLDERMKVSPGGDLGAQMLEVLDDNGGRFSETVCEISREAARDVIDAFDFEYHHVEGAVQDAVDCIDLADSIDWESLSASQFDLREFADYLSEEAPFNYALRTVDEHEGRLDEIGDQMCSVISMLEAIGIATEPSSNTRLFGDKRDDEQKFGDTLAHIAKNLTRDNRLAIIELADGMVTENKAAEGGDSEEN